MSDSRGRRGELKGGGERGEGELDFAEGTEDEVALHHSRMGNGEVGGGEVKVAVEEDVDVDGAVGVVVAGGLGGAAELAFDGLGGEENLVGREVCVEEDNGVEVAVGGVVSPGFGLDEG